MAKSQNNIQSILDQFDLAFDKKNYDLAEEITNNALKQYKNEPELYCRTIKLFILTQREAQAASQLKKAEGAKEFQTYAQHLLNHYHCRALMAKKLHVADQEGAGVLKEIQKLTKLEPEKVGIQLSACLIAKNEAKHLDRCLKSLAPIVDEIVLVDTGSTDNTVEIAKKYKAKIGHFEWNNDFSAARNESLKLASGQWILWIDADEELDASGTALIREALMRPVFGGYYIRIINYMSDNSSADQYVHTPIRLFRNLPEIKFAGKVHEQIGPFQHNGFWTATLKGATIHHYGYKPSEMQAKGKIDRTLDLLHAELKEDPTNGFQWFNLANIHAAAYNHRECIESARQALKYKTEDASYGRLCYQLLSNALTVTNQPDEALEICERAEADHEHSVLTEFSKATALYHSKRYNEALQSIDKCQQMEWPDDLMGDYSILTYKCHLLKGQVYAEQGLYQESLEPLEYALQKDPEFGATKYTLGSVYACLGQEDRALELLKTCYNDRNYGQKAMQLAAHLYFRAQKFAESAELLPELWQLGYKSEDYFSLWSGCCERLNNPNLLEQATQALKELTNPSSDLLINWGRALQQNQQFDQALEVFNKAILIDGNSQNAYLNKGDLLYSMENYYEAAECYQAGLQINNANPEAWFTLGNSLAKLGIFQGAVTSYQQTLTQNPNHEKAKQNLNTIQNMMASPANC